MFKIDKKDIKEITIYFIISRLLIFVFVYLCSEKLQSQGLNFWTLNDSNHYLNIATNGYQTAYEIAFFPLLPLLIHFFGKIPVVILNIIISYISCFLIYDLIKEIFPNKSPLLMTKIWIYNPIAVFTCMLYTESIFVFLTLLTFYLYRKKEKYLLQGILLGLAVCTRAPAAILFFVLFIFMVINIYKKQETIKNLLIMYIPATIISCIYPIYLQISVGKWNAFSIVQYECWNKAHSNIFKTIWYSIYGIYSHSGQYGIICIADTLFYFFFIGLIIYSIIKYRKDKSKYDILLFTLLTLLVVSSTCVTSNTTGTSATVSYYRYFYGCIGYILLLPDNKIYYYLQRIIFFITTCLFLMNYYFF